MAHQAVNPNLVRSFISGDLRYNVNFDLHSLDALKSIDEMKREVLVFERAPKSRKMDLRSRSGSDRV
jgi:hypothetical protein